MDNDTRLRLIYVQKMLEDTDEQHPLTSADIMQRLQDEHGITAHRTTLPTDIELLIKAGMEIEVIDSKPKKYYLNDYARNFNLPELKMLVDSVLKDFKELIVSFANLLYQIKLSEKDKNLLYKTFRANKKMLKSLNMKKKEFVPEIIDAVEEALSYKLSRES